VNRRPGSGPNPQGRRAPGGAYREAPIDGAALAKWEARLGQLSALVEQFRVDGERYFNGGLALPPEELRDRIHALLRTLRADQSRTAADQFRLASLEARFSSLSELYGRRLREREEGRAAVPRPATAEPARHDATAGIVFSDAADGGAVEALWSALAKAGKRSLELDTFHTYLTRQIDEIRKTTGATAVQFRVVDEEGKMKLKAKPLAGDDGRGAEG